MAKRALTMGVGVILVTGVVIAAVSCGPAGSEPLSESADGGIGQISSGLSRCTGGTNGDSNFCSDTCTCTQGQGDCDDDANCIDGTVCCSGKGLQFGLPHNVGVCAPAHCRDLKVDGDETQVDCGGSCGTVCGPACTGTDGTSNFCSDQCTCTQGEGDCDADSNCTGGTVCCPGKGFQFGFSLNFDVCAPAHCRDKVLDGDETQPDCGGSCGTVCGTSSCTALPANGVAGHCTSACPCAADQGGCTANNQCQSGLTCQNSPPDGPYFAMETAIRLCVPTTCSDKTQDGDETGVDCGGSCVPCLGGSILDATYGGSGGAGAKNDVVLGVAYDPSGNLYVAGRTSSQTINFGSGALTLNGGSDVFLAKFDPAGVNLWSQLIGGASNDGDSGVGVTTDSSGNVILVGDMYETVDFGGTCGTLTIPSGGTTEADVFVAKYDSTGACQWANHYGSGSGTGSARTSSVAADSSGNVYVVGSYQTSINLGGSTFTAVSASNGVSKSIYDMFVASYTSTGTHRWSSSYGSVDDDQGTGIALDSSGYVYVSGLYSDSVKFGSTTLTSAGNTDALGLRLAPSTGTPLWAVSWGGTTADRANAVTWVRPTNQAVFGGNFRGTVNFGAGNVKSAGSTDAFIVDLGATSKVYNWSKAFGGAGADSVFAIGSRPTESRILVAGSFAQSVNFGGGSRTASGSSTTATDGFNVFYDSTGTYLLDQTYGGTSNDAPNAVATNPTSIATAVIGGQFSSDSILLGGTTFTNTTSGAYDAFISRIVF